MWDEIPGAREHARGDEEDNAGCAFIIEDASPSPGRLNFCSAPREPGSAYCPPHHAFCHLPKGSAVERRQISEIEALAEAVGGRQGREVQHPPAGLLRRLDRIARAFSRPICS
jgi:hypothetical protein